jgi:hypothetical protein
MADRSKGFVDIESALLDATDGNGQHNFVRTGTNGATCYVFFVTSVNGGDLVYRKSTDSGATWGSQVVIEGTDAYIGVSVWYDRWTIGDTTGNTIHIFATDSTNLELTYFSLGVDDDSPETNNDVVIDTTATTISPDDAGRVCGCKGKNGDLLVGYVRTAGSGGNSQGWNFFKSDDTGATWALKESDGNPAQFLNNDADSALIMPLDTDDDFLLVGVDVTTDNVYTCVYDNSVADTWETAEIVLRIADLIDQAPYSSLNCAYNHSNADCFISVQSNSVSLVGNGTFTMFYDESTRAVAFDDYGVASGWLDTEGINYDQHGGGLIGSCLTRNADTGQLIMGGYRGDISNTVIAAYTVSNDNGRTWSDPQTEMAYESVTQTNTDDSKKMWTPPFTDTASGFTYVMDNDDLNDLRSPKLPLALFAAQTGNCKDNAGVNDEGVKVRMYQKAFCGNYNTVDNRDRFIGQDITDASGNWSITPDIVGYYNGLGGERNFYLTYYDDKGDIETPVFIKWRMDIDTWGEKSGTHVAYDTGNEEIDFDMSTETVDQHIFIAAPAGLVGNVELKWTIDFELRLDTVTQGAAETDSLVMIMLSGSNAGADANSKVFGLRVQVDASNLLYLLIASTGGSPMASTPKATFTTAVSTGSKFFRMGMKSKNIFSLALYSDEARTSLVEEQTYDITGFSLTASWNGANKFLYVATDDNSADDSTLTGAVKNIKIYAESTGNVTAIDSGSDTDLTDLSHVEGQI